MQLPDSLQPWSQWLEWFAPDHLPLFADLLGRLNPLLGPLRGRQQGGVPEPDGLGDLQRRGPYERLLSSEWLLAEEVPDEFLRRAAVGEHMFLAPQYRAREANRLMVVLFDAGPLQLGAARLVHLALLILLARRAAEAGAELRWGILQREPALYELGAASNLKQLLNARTYEVVSEQHGQAWRDWMAEQPQTVGECWLVGQRLPEAVPACCTHRAHVQRSLDGQSLSFELRAGGTRQVKLPMPDERQALQLLKGRFEGEAAEAPVINAQVPRVALTLPPVISGAGNYVALRLLDQPGMAVIKLPSPNQKKPLSVRTQLWSSYQHALAVTFLSRELGAVLSSEEALAFWNIPGLAPVKKPSREQLLLPPGTATFLPVAWLRNPNAERVYLLDSQGRLAYWESDRAKALDRSKPRQTHELASGVLGLARVDQFTLAYVRNAGGRLFAQSAAADEARIESYALSVAEGVSQVLFAGNSLWRRHFGGCALLTSKGVNESWHVITPKTVPVIKEYIDLASGWKAIGLLLDVGKDQPSLLLVNAGQRAIGLYSNGQQKLLFTTSDVISRYSFCPMSGLLAVLTSSRELLVYHVASGDLRLQVTCDKEPEHTKEGGDA
ncbi:hypothetical protein [Pseudomonas sp. SED1]|uniref:hypothetical protein n=1 Tax=Pseudomonas sp. SED1 TaxID=3056845 RepID=UPI00296FD7E0|nr:hypothetical protein [Pseudomonas sp. SED1]MDY0836074.1 hypothetical protein [Pseudomonas sp. SED1]